MENLIVIILGNRLNDDDSISKIQEERLLLTLEIEEEFKPDYFILSGGLANPKAKKTEADAMYEYLVAKGIDEKKLIKEGNSLSTVENALYSVPIAEKLGAKTIMVCSSAYHFGNPVYKAMETFVKEIEGKDITLMTYCR
jgi:uncharacterized SAM-binding protein YcdF (DUF218 family)